MGRTLLRLPWRALRKNHELARMSKNSMDARYVDHSKTSFSKNTEFTRFKNPCGDHEASAATVEPASFTSCSYP